MYTKKINSEEAEGIKRERERGRELRGLKRLGELDKQIDKKKENKGYVE